MYIPPNPANKVLYIGITSNLSDRLAQHYANRGSAGTFAGRYFCYNLVHVEEYPDSNAAIAGYVRGQALVCLCLGAVYAVGLSIVGLEFGFVIGLIAGALSFLPFVGTLVGTVRGVGRAIAQVPPGWVVVGLLLHGIFDLLHGRMVDNRGVPSWWPPFCLTYDFAAAAWLGCALFRRPAEVGVSS